MASFRDIENMLARANVWIRRVMVGVLIPFVLILVVWDVSGPRPPVSEISHVIVISFDGLRADAISRLGPSGVPAFYEVLSTGAGTLNARTDHDFTVTLPNHTCMLTGRPVLGEGGHGYTSNDDNIVKTLHENKGQYVAGIFDVVHGHALRGAFFSSKPKFSLYIKSYGARGVLRAVDAVSAQEQQLIDFYRISGYNDDAIVDAFLHTLKKHAPHFTFLHLSGLDATGHDYGWDPAPESVYMNEVRRMDRRLERVLRFLKEDRTSRGTTVVIVTADHGGYGTHHKDVTDPRDYTIPFLVWGNHVAQGADLYKLNPGTRKDPEQERVPYGAGLQPVRNGDAPNLALSLLGLPSIPGSSINVRQDLSVYPLSPAGK